MNHSGENLGGLGSSSEVSGHVERTVGMASGGELRPGGSSSGGSVGPRTRARLGR